MILIFGYHELRIRKELAYCGKMDVTTVQRSVPYSQTTARV